jgi:predicted amino acid dehydrogenase
MAFVDRGTLQRKQNLTGLAPKRGLIAVQPIERIGWQVGQANKGVVEIVGLVSKRVARWINASGEVILIRP